MSSTGEKTNTQPAAAIPISALDNLGSRFRPGGFFLIVLNPDGSIAYHDQAASAFFQRFVLPLLDRDSGDAPELHARIAAVTAQSSVEVWNCNAGVIVAAFPQVERKHLQSVVLLAGKSAAFRLNDQVVRIAASLGIDGIWLNQQAEQLPAHCDESIQRQARLLLGMLRDQVRLGTLEGELDSMSGQLSNAYEELSLIYQLSSGMKINRTPEEFFKQACMDVMDLMKVRGMGVAVRTETPLLPEPGLFGTLVLPPAKLHRLTADLMRILEERKKPLLVNQLSGDRRLHWLAEYAHQLLAVPLQRGDQMLGCIFALDKDREEFNTVDSKMLTSIANESAIYLENSMLYEDVRGLMMGLMHSLVSAVDAKDTYTCGHSERVALLSRLIAQEAKLDPKFVERIYMGGLLHDVGKIGVPEAVLQKTGKLTPEEFEEIKKHPEIGARILKDIKQIQDIIPGVLYHHERYDGRGYPAKLSGESIPLIGRVICLADCFDAMTSSRTYRKALPLEVALTEIRRCAGTQFDPALADVFLGVSADRFRELLGDHKAQTRRIIDAHRSLRAA